MNSSRKSHLRSVSAVVVGTTIGIAYLCALFILPLFLMESYGEDVGTYFVFFELFLTFIAALFWVKRSELLGAEDPSAQKVVGALASDLKIFSVGLVSAVLWLLLAVAIVVFVAGAIFTFGLVISGLSATSIIIILLLLILLK
ncbi:MAG: hypothetical protein AAB921_03780 [Patescibacteria group bacterium]